MHRCNGCKCDLVKGETWTIESSFGHGLLCTTCKARELYGDFIRINAERKTRRRNGKAVLV